MELVITPAQRAVAKFAADVTKASAAGSSVGVSIAAPAPKFLSGAVQMKCGNDHNVVWHAGTGTYRHTDAADCGDTAFHGVRQTQVSARAREAYRAMRMTQKEAK